MNKKVSIAFIIILAVVAGYFTYKQLRQEPNLNVPVAATFLCNGGKNIDVVFHNSEPIVSEPGQPPIPTGSVDIVLSDGRKMTLPQTISASGVRYANEDESFVFWNKGNGALVLENNNEKSYIGCIEVADDPGDLPNIYHDGSTGFTVRYPQDYTLDDSYIYQYLGPGKDIYGIKFIIPASMASGKNLSSFDTGVSVEFIPAVQNCNADLFLDHADVKETITDNNTEYSYASVVGAAAGNRYEEIVWAIPYTNPCMAVRYLIHSTNIGNYPVGAVTEFDRGAVLGDFDKIRQTLIINQ